MVPLKVICAGFGRTGTDSLRLALNHLGYNTHHMYVMMNNEGEQDPEAFEDAYRHPEREVDWDKLYAGFSAAADWPTIAFIEPLMKKYPDAKVILTVRDPEDCLINTVVLDGAFADPKQFLDKGAMKAKFLAHNKRIQETIPADSLLVMQVGEGWNRLCQFLNKPVPDIPYPRTNSTDDIARARRQLR
ncbi:P-loop containing nucleoside triphosphate hydrolase protein [Zychaea mexicana]|uniref:P-loop containing nucleoside triphosphate hydrolase protein n=1 Tax=Zychaea mexicana TaxID=64656 RepID=UPI0022FDFE64|nr:P-loop containing nucleoside triphosphate hydrolase protein [Zychaea mexicana]KAI9492807.1 P-loop containing nucleoside triphosphate hydrolase protein [Zychaea mexicana]